MLDFRSIDAKQADVLTFERLAIGRERRVGARAEFYGVAVEDVLDEDGVAFDFADVRPLTRVVDEEAGVVAVEVAAVAAEEDQREDREATKHRDRVSGRDDAVNPSSLGAAGEGRREAAEVQRGVLGVSVVAPSQPGELVAGRLIESPRR